MARRFSLAPALMTNHVQLLFDMGFWQRFAVEFLPVSAYKDVPRRMRKPVEDTLVALTVSFMSFRYTKRNEQ